MLQVHIFLALLIASCITLDILTWNKSKLEQNIFSIHYRTGIYKVLHALTFFSDC